MSKEIICVKIDNDKYDYEEAEMIMNQIYDIIGEEYHIIGIPNDVDVQCLNDDDKIIKIDGKSYTRKEMIKLFEDKGLI